MARDRHGAGLAGAREHLLDGAVGGDEAVEAEREGVGRAPSRERVARELAAGEDDHPVRVPGAPRLALDLGAVGVEVVLRDREPAAVRDLSEKRVRVDDVVGDGDDVVAGAPEEVDDLGDRQAPVRPGRVHVEVGQQHGSPSCPGKMGPEGAERREPAVQARVKCAQISVQGFPARAARGTTCRSRGRSRPRAAGGARRSRGSTAKRPNFGP